MHKNTKQNRKKNWISISKYYSNQNQLPIFFEIKIVFGVIKKLGRIRPVGFYGKTPNYGRLMFVKHYPF